jgi:hypothetical protein
MDRHSVSPPAEAANIAAVNEPSIATALGGFVLLASSAQPAQLRTVRLTSFLAWSDPGEQAWVVSGER